MPVLVFDSSFILERWSCRILKPVIRRPRGIHRIRLGPDQHLSSGLDIARNRRRNQQRPVAPGRAEDLLQPALVGLRGSLKSTCKSAAAANNKMLMLSVGLPDGAKRNCLLEPSSRQLTLARIEWTYSGTA